MNTKQLIGLALLLVSNAASATTPLDDIATVKGSKYIIDEVSLCQIKPESLIGLDHEPVKFQVKTHSEASRSVVSRDWFVAVNTILGLSVRGELAKASAR